jgi:hypothetical protein
VFVAISEMHAIVILAFIVICRDVAGKDLLRDGLAVGGDWRLL